MRLCGSTHSFTCARNRRTVRHQRRRSVKTHGPLPDCGKRAAVPRQETKRVMGHARPRPQQDDGNRLMWNLIISRHQIAASCSDETQASVLDFESPPIEPHQPVPIRMWDARFFETQTSKQHSVSPNVPTAATACRSRRRYAARLLFSTARQMHFHRQSPTPRETSHPALHGSCRRVPPYYAADARSVFCHHSGFAKAFGQPSFIYVFPLDPAFRR